MTDPDLVAVKTYLTALIALNVRVATEIAAMGKTPELAREIMFHFETKTIEDIQKLEISLGNPEREGSMEDVREKASGLIASLLSMQKFT